MKKEYIFVFMLGNIILILFIVIGLNNFFRGLWIELQFGMLGLNLIGVGGVMYFEYI